MITIDICAIIAIAVGGALLGFGIGVLLISWMNRGLM